MPFRQEEDLRVIQLKPAIFGRCTRLLEDARLNDYTRSSAKNGLILPYMEFKHNDNSIILRFHKQNLGSKEITYMQLLFPIALGYSMYVKIENKAYCQRYFNKFDTMALQGEL